MNESRVREARAGFLPGRSGVRCRGKNAIGACVEWASERTSTLGAEEPATRRARVLTVWSVRVHSETFAILRSGDEVGPGCITGACVVTDESARPFGKRRCG